MESLPALWRGLPRWRSVKQKNSSNEGDVFQVNRRRVVITGIGPITPIGTTNDEFWSGLQRQRSAVRSLSRFDPSPFRSHNAAEINDFVPGDHLESKRAKRMDRFAQFSVVGAQ